MTSYALLVTAIALTGVLVAILLFERKRARRIEHDLRDSRHRRDD